VVPVRLASRRLPVVIVGIPVLPRLEVAATIQLLLSLVVSETLGAAELP